MMSHIESFLLGYLLNALWQVPLVFIAATLSALLLRRHGSLTVHRVWVAALVLQGALPALTRIARPFPAVVAWLLRAGRPAEDGGVTVTLGPVIPLSSFILPALLGQVLTVLYAAALLYASARLVWGLHRTALLGERTSAPFLDPLAADAWQACLRRFHLRRVALRESTVIRTPMTMGLRMPVVLLPAGLGARLSHSELHTLFAHECAHIARRDFAWNLLYELLAMPVAWHPFIRLTRSRLVESREWVCDDLALHANLSPVAYARSLLRLATALAPPVPDIAPHAIGMLDANALERRVMHLTQTRSRLTWRQRSAALAASALIGLSTCASAWAWRTGVVAPTSQGEAAGPSTKVPSEVMAGNSLTRVPPSYPQDAKDAHVEGSVVLRAVISKAGVVENLSVVSGPDELAASAIEAVKKWTYKPYILNGEPVAVETTITVNYQLAD